MRVEDPKATNGLNAHWRGAYLAVLTATRLVLGPTVHTALANFLRHQRSAWNLRGSREAHPSESQP